VKKLLLAIPFLFLAGCQSSPMLIETKLAVVTPPAEMYNCPLEKRYPNWQTLNDVEVAKTIVRLYKNNRICKASIEAVEKYLNEAKARIED
jgi:hypothetical protein